ncbi:predicted protein [Botrytis cinerea T4]|uniref:Uncharacterized protein n=1 Tax=Botryotinia fuckeliana (strain T4) TaxID=999810 RepID=G2YCP7_BOTF4|nr:predicted protein [Botrytis cinerea T4]
MEQEMEGEIWNTKSSDSWTIHGLMFVEHTGIDAQAIIKCLLEFNLDVHFIPSFGRAYSGAWLGFA